MPKIKSQAIFIVRLGDRLNILRDGKKKAETFLVIQCPINGIGEIKLRSAKQVSYKKEYIYISNV